MIIYLWDKLRISFGDSQCPLYHKCPGADNEKDSCVSHRGRDETSGKRKECYEFFKPIIRTQKPNLISKMAGKFAESMLNMKGEKD